MKFKIGDKVKCISKGTYDFLTIGKVYTIVEINGTVIKVKDDSDSSHWYFKNKFITDSVINYDIPTYERDIFTGKQNINIPKLPDIDLNKIARDLELVIYRLNKFNRLNKRELEVNNIKELHKDIQNIYFNEDKRTTVIVFKNGDKVKATASKDTPFSEYAGFVTALFKYEKGLKLKDVEHLIKKKRK
jgi:hypothetical protein